jgi:hypothetical protein
MKLFKLTNPPQLNKRLIYSPRRTFLLKYLQQRGLMKQENTKQQAIDLKNLLDENNIKLTYYDIYKDWKNFRNAYYFMKLPEEPQKEPKKLPFDKKDMTVKSFIYEFFNNDYLKYLMKITLSLYIVAAYMTYRVNKLERKNIERLEMLQNETSGAEKGKVVYNKLNS